MKWSEFAHSCLTLCDPMGCSLPGFSVHGIFQARVLEWVAISFSREPSQPRNRTQVSRIAGRRFTIWATREDLLSVYTLINFMSCYIDLFITMLYSCFSFIKVFVSKSILSHMVQTFQLSFHFYLHKISFKLFTFILCILSPDLCVLYGTYKCVQPLFLIY